MRPRAQKLLADYLRQQTSLRVVAKTPRDTDSSWVRLSQLGAPQAANSTVDHLVAYYMQLDCYAGEGGGEPEAEEMQRAVCDAITRISRVSQSGWVPTMGRVEGSSYVPDTELEPARERFIVTATVSAHP